MAKLNKNIISPVLEHGNGYVFNVAGQNFKIVGIKAKRARSGRRIFLKKCTVLNCTTGVLWRRFQ